MEYIYEYQVFVGMAIGLLVGYMFGYDRGRDSTIRRIPIFVKPESHSIYNASRSQLEGH